MLPNEAEYAKSIRNELKPVFDVAEALVKLSVDVITQREFTESQPSPPVASRLGHGLCIRATKSMRSTLALSEIGSVSDLTSITRTIFETVIAAAFILKDTVSLGIKGVDDGKLTPDFRAKLYWAYLGINKLENLKRLKDSDYTKIAAVQIPSKRWEDDALQAESVIGSDWANRLRKHPRTYSGLTLSALADKLGPEYGRWYVGVYGAQSTAIHATDVTDHLTGDSSGSRMVASWYLKPSKVGQLISVNGLMLCQCLSLLNDRLKFKGNLGQELERFMFAFGGFHEVL